ncbi:MAG: hypothetical protein QMC89_01240 [Candidatus Hodarchaeaceae archaeon]|nr:hypothetical protein [Candidatus Hodarchaeaceae archaeon]
MKTHARKFREERLGEVKKHRNETNIGLLFRGPLYRGGRENLCFIP